MHFKERPAGGLATASPSPRSRTPAKQDRPADKPPRDVDDALADHSRHFVAKKKHAFTLLANRYFGEAETALREAHNMCPSNLNAIFALAVASCVVSQYKAAEALCRLAVDQTGRTAVYRHVKKTKHSAMYSRIARGRATEADYAEVKKEVLWYAAQVVGMPVTAVTAKPKFWETFLSCPWTNACAVTGRLDECMELNPLVSRAERTTKKYRSNMLNFVPLEVRAGPEDAAVERAVQGQVASTVGIEKGQLSGLLPCITGQSDFQAHDEFVYRRSRKPKPREPLSHPTKTESQLHTHLTYMRPHEYIVGERQAGARMW